MHLKPHLCLLTRDRGFLFAKTTVRRLSLCRQYSDSLETEIPMPISRRPAPDPNHPLPVLVLPPRAETLGRTTRRMMQAEAEEYLYPLYLRGWHVEDIRIRDEKNKRIRTPYLTNKFYLKGQASAREAVGKILEIEKEEKHDISFELFLGIKPELTLRMQTHSARKWPPGSINEVSSNITLNDIRFAVLFERAVTHHLSERTVRNRITPNPQLRWDALLSRFPYTDSYTAPLKKKSE